MSLIKSQEISSFRDLKPYKNFIFLDDFIYNFFENILSNTSRLEHILNCHEVISEEVRLLKNCIFRCKTFLTKIK